jgi:pimeloyl-ACP methyl ester carboxylesterase
MQSINPLHVQKYGSGPKVLLCFHGIGQDHSCFLKLFEALSPHYTCYGFDLYHHGQSPSIYGRTAHPTERLSKEAWRQYLTAWLRSEGIGQFGVLGFSMGGKFALATAEAFTERLDSLTLLAPDGITESPWYRLATRYALTQRVFKWYVLNTHRFRQLAQVLLRLRLLDKSTIRFAESTLATPAQRLRVYHSWLGFSSLTFDIPRLTQLLNQHGVSVRIFLGRFDALLPAHYMNPLTKRLNQFELVMLRTGHHKLVDKVAEWLSERPESQP